jgi:hypothetical protein
MHDDNCSGPPQSLAAATLHPRPFAWPPSESASSTTREVDEDGGGEALVPSSCLWHSCHQGAGGRRQSTPVGLSTRHPSEVVARGRIRPVRPDLAGSTGLRVVVSRRLSATLAAGGSTAPWSRRHPRYFLVVDLLCW